MPVDIFPKKETNGNHPFVPFSETCSLRELHGCPPQARYVLLIQRAQVLVRPSSPRPYRQQR